MSESQNVKGAETPTNCPHCGASVEESSNDWGVFFECGSLTRQRDHLHQPSDLCRERAARQKAEAAHAETRKELLEECKAVAIWNARWKLAEAELAETRKELEETRRKLGEAAQLISRIVPYIHHTHPRCSAVCLCGMRDIIMEAGETAGVVTPKAKEGK